MASSSYGSREGLTSRQAASSSSREISLQIDPINADLDDHILGLRGQLSKLKGGIVALDLPPLPLPLPAAFFCSESSELSTKSFGEGGGLSSSPPRPAGPSLNSSN